MSNSTSIRQLCHVEPIWDDLPDHTETLDGVSRATASLRFRRKGNSHRGLGEFANLKQLVIFCPNQDAIEEIGSLHDLEFLYIDETRAKDLTPLSGCRSLKYLTIKAATQVTDLEWVCDLPPIKSFVIEQFNKLTDISPLASLTDLMALGIEGGMWKRQKVETFLPLSDLGGLEALFITNCKPLHDGLAPLHELKHLRYLESAGLYSEDEFRALELALPQLSCHWFDQIREYGSIKAAINASINNQS